MPVHVASKDVGPNSYSVHVEVGDEILIVQYFIQKGSKSNSYVLEKDMHLAYVFLYHVCASKFPM